MFSFNIITSGKELQQGGSHIDISDIIIAMNKLVTGFVQRVYKVRVQGKIDQKMADAVARGLQKSWPYQPSALMVTINSPGGSVVQAKTIADLLQLYSNRYNIPSASFVEDQCLGSAHIVLSSTAKAYANPFSMLGDIGASWQTLWLDRFANKYDIKQQYVAAGENKVKFNPFEPIRSDSEKWMSDRLASIDHELRAVITDNRHQQFTKKGVTKETLEEKLFKKGVVDSEEAVELGLIDGIRSMDEQLKARYSSTQVREVNKARKSPRERLGFSF